MQTNLTKQRRNSHFTQNQHQDHQTFIPTMKKCQSSIKLAEVQTFKRIQQGYFTPNNFKIKFMCKNHVNTKSTHYYETTDGQKIHYCSLCSNEITKQGFSVKILNSNQTLNKNQNSQKFEPKKIDFFKKKSNSYQREKFEVLKMTEQRFSQLEKRANLQIIEIDELGKKLLGQLNHKFNDVMRFLQNQKQNCIQLIFDKMDQLKKPLHEIKNTICSEKWELQNIKSRLDLLTTQQSMEEMKESLATISNNEFKKVETIAYKREELDNKLYQRIIMDKKGCFESLGSVQEIIDTVYNNFLLETDHINILSDLSPQLIPKEICMQTTSEFPSPIKTKHFRQPESNKTLKQEIENIENTINRNEKSKSYGFFEANVNFRKINEFANNIKQQTNHPIKKRPSEHTTISSLTNLMS